MKLKIKNCPCTLNAGYSSYSPGAEQLLFGSRAKKVSHILPFGPLRKNNELINALNENRKHISISGVQEKYSLKEYRNKLFLTDSNGSHILKPVPGERLAMVADLPANEHVSMQIARQVFRINTAASGMIFFEDGSPAYLTRRFDYKPDGTGKYQIEDFATLLARSPETEGDNYKYNASYLDIAQTIHQLSAASSVVLLEFFRLLIFNYLIGNGDAHLKNFSLMESDQGDYLLSPAYDLLCTALHIDDSTLALSNGLYEKDFEESTYQTFGYYTRASFIAFAKKAKINTELAATIIDEMIEQTKAVNSFLQRSFLSKEAKTKYLEIIQTRRNNLLTK
jgi:serine/threonine-protein kinase HipA